MTEDIELYEHPPRKKIARNKSIAATVAGALSGIEGGNSGREEGGKATNERMWENRASRGQVEMTWNGGEPCGV